MTASLILRKLGAYPRQNSLALALRELGCVERTLFILEWLQSPEWRRRVHVGLNKGRCSSAQFPTLPSPTLARAAGSLTLKQIGRGRLCRNPGE